ncbi:hypothetical protein MNBD_ALPHA06-286 [hydrothermal vent metagenome]|uniref:Formyl transferase N-terminal domain-containing protein n=1 Tax=hydrothermal vent metagenome TaxID=652676 RepID=A0A3B0S334_9ZZZZ
MAYRIVVLTKPVEAPFLLQFVRRENPGLEVETALNEAELRQKIGSQAADTRLISFNCNTIVPKDILDLLGPVPYNIHPGPPAYPGTYPIAYALKDKARQYGATAHEIWEKVDAGPIVYAEQQTISPDISLQQLTELAFTLATKAFSVIASHCAQSATALPHLAYQWSQNKSTHKSYQQMCKPPANATPTERAELKRICGDDLIT